MQEYERIKIRFINMKISSKVPKNRPAFHVDEKLRQAARKAAQAFEQEEKDLERYKYEKV